MFSTCISKKNARRSFDMMSLLAGRQDQLQIDGIIHLIKAMQEISSPSPAAAPVKPKLACSDSPHHRQQQQTCRLHRQRKCCCPFKQTAAMRSSTPVSTTFQELLYVTVAATCDAQPSSSSLDRSQAARGSNAVMQWR